MEYKAEQRVRLRRLKDDDAAAGMLRAEGWSRWSPLEETSPWLLRPYLILAEPVARLVKTHDACSSLTREGKRKRKREGERKSSQWCWNRKIGETPRADAVNVVERGHVESFL